MSRWQQAEKVEFWRVGILVKVQLSSRKIKRIIVWNISVAKY
jgi:hypothetical protein